MSSWEKFSLHIFSYNKPKKLIINYFNLFKLFWLVLTETYSREIFNYFSFLLFQDGFDQAGIDDFIPPFLSPHSRGTA